MTSTTNVDIYLNNNYGENFTKFVKTLALRNEELATSLDFRNSYEFIYQTCKQLNLDLTGSLEELKARITVFFTSLLQRTNPDLILSTLSVIYNTVNISYKAKNALALFYLRTKNTVNFKKDIEKLIAIGVSLELYFNGYLTVGNKYLTINNNFITIGY